MREETFERQRRLGVIPQDAELTLRNDAFPAWDSLDEDQRRLYARQMEVYAGFQENADHNVGRVLDAIAEMSELDNTLVIWICGDNGGLDGRHRDRLVQRADHAERHSPDPEQQLALVQRYGGLEVWGSELIAPHFSAAWAWAGNAPPFSGASRSPPIWAAPATRRSSTGRPRSGTGARSGPSSPT
jgi:arylsulfatase A-like enzyme